MHAYSQLVEFTLQPGQQAGLVAALTALDEQFTCTFAGFIGASVQASEDGQRVLHQVLWQSRQECEAALLNVESGVPDMQALIRSHRVRSASFGSYRVLSQVLPLG